MSGKGQSRLKLSGNGNECKPLYLGIEPLCKALSERTCKLTSLDVGRGLHSFPFPLNFSLL